MVIQIFPLFYFYLILFDTMSIQNKEKRQVLATAIASPFASFIAKFVCHPIDTIKSKVQANKIEIKNINQYRFGMARKMIKSTWKQEGIKGFFRGVTISVFGSMIAFSAYMSAYEKAKQQLKKNQFIKEHDFIAHFLSGIIAEGVSCSLWLPIDIVKERLQVQSEVKVYSYNGPRDAIKKINKSEGIIGLYRAFGATLMFFGPFSAIFFLVFQNLKKRLVKVQEKPTLKESIICSCGASGFAGFLTTPLEMVKLRMQIQRADIALKGSGKLQDSVYGYKNIFHGLYTAYKTEGFLSLYKGGLLRICFVIPIVTLSISLSEQFKHIAMEMQFLDRFS